MAGERVGLPVIVALARMCHQLNREYCDSIGEFGQPDWDNAPKWQQDSAIAGVIFHLDNPTAGDQASHENWMRQKVEDGWVWGPVKDPEAKTHPCVLPFHQLPVAQQVKDRLFRQTVHAAFPAVAEYQQDRWLRG